MPHRRPYRPQTPRPPADITRADTCDTRRFVNPLTGIWATSVTVPCYWYGSPNGDCLTLGTEGSTSVTPTIVHCSFYIVHCWTYTFSAKERDPETGLSYFGSRYYSSDLSIWLSVDQMAAKYPHQSNYVYCSNNPIRIIDPNGEDEWDLARNGTLTKRENGRTDIDIVHATTSEGEATSRNFPANSINQNKDFYTFKHKDYDDNGESYMKSCTTNYMHFSDLDVGYSFFEFAAENTSVEWAISSSDKEVRVGTTGEELFVRMPGVTNEKEFHHSHDLKHTGEKFISQADRDAAKYYINKNVSTGVYMAGERQYYMFEKKAFPNGTFYDYFGSKKPARSNNN